MQRKIRACDIAQVLLKMVVCDRFQGPRPRIQPRQRKQDGDEQKRQKRQSPHRRTQNAADDHAPTALGEMTKHQDRHRPEADPQPVHEIDEVGAEENCRLYECADDHDDARNPTQDHHASLDNFDDRRRHQVEIIYPRSAHRCSPSIVGVGVAPEPGSPKTGGSEGTFCPGGTSAAVAPWLNCRARIYATMHQRSRTGICATSCPSMTRGRDSLTL